jgi:hypothetical protein
MCLSSGKCLSGAVLAGRCQQGWPNTWSIEKKYVRGGWEPFICGVCESTLKSLVCLTCIWVIGKHVFIRRLLTCGSTKGVVLCSIFGGFFFFSFLYISRKSSLCNYLGSDVHTFKDFMRNCLNFLKHWFKASILTVGKWELPSLGQKFSTV